MIDPSRFSHAIPTRLQIRFRNPGLSMMLYAIQGFFHTPLSVGPTGCIGAALAWFSITPPHPAAPVRPRALSEHAPCQHGPLCARSLDPFQDERGVPEWDRGGLDLCATRA